MKLSAFSIAGVCLIGVAVFRGPSVSAKSDSASDQQQKLAVNSPDAFEGMYQGKMADLIWLFSDTPVMQSNADKSAKLSVRIKNGMLRFKAEMPGERTQVEYIPIDGNWDKAASEFTISKKEDRAYAREDVHGYIWNTEVVEVFLNSRHALVVKHKTDMRCLENSRPPEQTHSEITYNEFASTVSEQR